MEERKSFYTRDEVLKLCEGLPTKKKYETADKEVYRGHGISVWIPEVNVLVVPYALLFLNTPKPVGIRVIYLSSSILGRCIVGAPKPNPSATGTVESVVFGAAKSANAYGRIIASLNDLSSFESALREAPLLKKALERAADWLDEPHRSRLLAFLLSNEITRANWVVLRGGVFVQGSYQTEEEARMAATAGQIRQRQSYRFWKEWINFLNTQPSKTDILKKVDSEIDARHGYGNAENAARAEESLKLAIKDAQNNGGGANG